MFSSRSLRWLGALYTMVVVAACGGDDMPWKPASHVVQLPGAASGVLHAMQMNFPASGHAVLRVDAGGRFEPSGVADRGSLIELRVQPSEGERLPLVVPAGEVVSSRTADNARIPRARTIVSYAQLAAGPVHLTLVSDFIARRLEAYQDHVTTERFFALQDTLAGAFFEGDITGDGDVTYADVLAFDPTNGKHLAALRFDYEKVLDEPSSDCACTLRKAYASPDPEAVSKALDQVIEEHISYVLPDPRNSGAVANVNVSVPKGGGAITIDELPGVVVDDKNPAFEYHREVGAHAALTLRAKPDAADGKGYRFARWIGCDDERPDGACVVKTTAAEKSVAAQFALEPTLKPTVPAFVKVLSFPASTVMTALDASTLTVTVLPGSEADKALAAMVVSGVVASGEPSRPLAKVTAITKPRTELDATHAVYTFDTVEVFPYDVFSEGTMLEPGSTATIDDVTNITAAEATATDAAAQKASAPARALPVRWILGYGKAFEMADGVYIVGDPKSGTPYMARARGATVVLSADKAREASWQSCRANPLSPDCKAFDPIALPRVQRSAGPVAPCSIFSSDQNCPIKAKLKKSFFNEALVVSLQLEVKLGIRTWGGIDFGPGLFVSGESRGRLELGIGARLFAGKVSENGTYTRCGVRQLPGYKRAKASTEQAANEGRSVADAVGSKETATDDGALVTAAKAKESCDKKVKDAKEDAQKKIVTMVDYSMELSRPTPDGAAFPLRVGFKAGVEMSGNAGIQINYVIEAVSNWESSFAFGKKCRRWGLFDCDPWRFDVDGRGNFEWGQKLTVDLVANAEVTPFAAVYVSVGPRGIKEDLIRIEAKAGLEHGFVGGISGFQYTSLAADRALGVSGWCWSGKGGLFVSSDFVASAALIADFTFQKDLGFATLDIGRAYNLYKTEYRRKVLEETPIIREFSVGTTTCKPLDEAADGLDTSKEWKPGALDWNGAPRLAWTKTHELTLQTDGNLVLHRFERDGSGKVTNRVPIWSTGTHGRPGARADFQRDGNLVMYDIADRPIWASGSNGKGATRLTLQSNGDLVIYAGNQALWTSKTAGK